MAGSNRNLMRRKVMAEYGMEHERFHIDALFEHMNSYKTGTGRPHKQVSISRQQLSSLLRANSAFLNLDNGYYIYNGVKNVMD